MNAQDLAKTLDQLCRAEQNSMIPRLAQCAVFLSWASADEHYAVRKMVSEETEHVAWLIDMINELGESPTPGYANIRTTSLHFVDLDYVMPQVITDKQNLLRFYEASAARVAHHAGAAALLNTIITRHRAHLEKLQAIASKATLAQEVKSEE